MKGNSKELLAGFETEIVVILFGAYLFFLIIKGIKRKFHRAHVYRAPRRPDLNQKLRSSNYIPHLYKLRPKPIMTASELEFFHRLQLALPEYQILGQVALNALLCTDRNLLGDAKKFLRYRFEKKVADFVVCEKTTLKVLAIIELDDPTHDAQQDSKRDRLLNAAGYKTLRFDVARQPSESEIRQIFLLQPKPQPPLLHVPA